MECGEPPWLDGRKRAKVRCVPVQVLDPQQHSATTQQTLASSLASQQSKKLKTNNIVIVILYARVSSTKQLRYNQNDRVRADTEHNNFECTWVEEHGAVDWEASMAW